MRVIKIRDIPHSQKGVTVGAGYCLPTEVELEVWEEIPLAKDS